jgi:hypothetical protein
MGVGPGMDFFILVFDRRSADGEAGRRFFLQKLFD